MEIMGLELRQPQGAADSAAMGGHAEIGWLPTDELK